jgi:hypothetical protein
VSGPYLKNRRVVEQASDAVEERVRHTSGLRLNSKFFDLSF